MSGDEILRRGQLRRRIRAAPEFARVVRERAGLTQVELARLLGCSQGSISKWERGESLPSAPALGRLAALLDHLEARAS